MGFFDNKNIYFIMGPILIMFIICGIIYPAVMIAALSSFRHIAASAASAIGSLNMVITSLAAFILSFVSTDSAVPIMLSYLILMILGMLVYRFLRVNENYKASRALTTNK